MMFIDTSLILEITSDYRLSSEVLLYNLRFGMLSKSSFPLFLVTEKVLSLVLLLLLLLSVEVLVILK